MQSGARLRIGACLSLTGRYARFGGQAAAGLRAWQALTGGVELEIEDDGSDPERLAAGLPRLARRSDLLLGPYSTGLTRAAGRALPEIEGLLWNHGGSGDDVQALAPGRVVSVPAPASRYAEPLLRHLTAGGGRPAFALVCGPGSFGRQVTDGAEALARQLRLRVTRPGPGETPEGGWGAWDVLAAGTFEHDVALAARLLGAQPPPRTLCAVAAGVRDFAPVVGRRDGVYGIGQWAPGAPGTPALGPAEARFLRTYRSLTGTEPDYPAVQAAAAAAIAVHCARLAGSLRPTDLWAAAAGLRTRTLLGAFRIDPEGRQVGHRTVLVRWVAGSPVRVG